MPEENAHKFLFAIVLLGLVFFIGRDASRVSGENSGREVQVTSLAQVMAAPFAEEAQTPPLAQVPPRATAVAAADAPTDAFLRTSAVAVPELHVRAALAADLQTGQELFALNPYQRWPIASLTKLMTAVVAKTEIGPEKPVLVSEAAIAADGPAGGFGAGGGVSGARLHTLHHRRLIERRRRGACGTLRPERFRGEDERGRPGPRHDPDELRRPDGDLVARPVEPRRPAKTRRLSLRGAKKRRYKSLPPEPCARLRASTPS